MIVEMAEQHGKIPAMTEGGSPGGFRDGYGCDFWTRKQIGPILNDPRARRVAWYHAWSNHPTSTWFGPVPGDCSGNDFKTICDRADTLLEGDEDYYRMP
ncbi:MAG: hypothetical protein HY698_00510 [Deltaproteobacteria bacterium]|nr:hypothetical protein [Deltaproteobacteria bacterium]